ncbi:thermonuclease family protein [Oricola cellulosilytica]|nr:thermonuclease family protein [Oricola cellulosilytica]
MSFILSVSDLIPTITTDPVVTNATVPQLELPVPARPRAMPVCGSGRRFNCVVDGDTLWVDGEKIRVANIDAPEVRGRCGRESVLAAEATRRLGHLLDRKPISIRALGSDRFGRTLAVVATPDGDVGEALVRQQLAVRWRGRREPASTLCAG